MKTILLAALLIGVSANVHARDHAYAIKSGLRAVATIEGTTEQRVSVRVGKGAAQEIARLDDEAIDYFETPDIDHDGYRDLAIGQSGGGGQVHARLFLYRPQERRFQEIQHPAPEASPCRRFVNPVFDAQRAAFSVGCRYGADSMGTEEYVLRANGTARPERWTTQALFDLEDKPFELSYGFNEDGTVARIQIDGEGSPLDGDSRVPFDRIDLYDAPDVKALSTQTAKAGDRLDVVALRPQWLQVRYPAGGADAPLKWVRYADLKIDKYAYAPQQRMPMRGLSLAVRGHLGTQLYEAGGRFTLHVTNLGPDAATLASPRIWLLFTDAQGRRTLQPLYQRPAVTLGPPTPPSAPAADPYPSQGEDRAAPPPAAAPRHVADWADDPVVWRAGEDGKMQYQVNEGNGQYVAFFPDLAAGRYRLAVVLTDPGLEQPVYSNEIEVDYPFRKQPPAATSSNSR
ncbi:hypothetical protein [Achromobacter xylosoxidans]|uniref:hypothetical protein n=1 Tax=Alcaligenes xylosoxydans xylosoxydans TaxID=85698 RepID=UPI0012A91996|nr:hypothetical protein [Achromobacter xylosoxidans]CUR67321.1 hypothetical protein BN2877_27370 [Achromobacter xylosoxidans]